MRVAGAMVEEAIRGCLSEGLALWRPQLEVRLSQQAEGFQRIEFL
jgi:hypothetical protein